MDLKARLDQTKNELDQKIKELEKMKSELKEASDKANVSLVKNESEDVFDDSSLAVVTTPKPSRKMNTQSQAIAKPKKDSQSTSSNQSNTGSSEIRRLPRKSMNETRSSGASSRRGYSGSDQVMGCFKI